MNILAIDPGPIKSAYVLWDGKSITGHGILDNVQLKSEIISGRSGEEYLVIEMIASYGMPAGKSLFETCLWIGRFLEAWENFEGEAKLIYRKDVKMHFCNSMRAKDSNIRQALIDRFGKPGTKKSPGKLYGIKKDEWSALALAIYFADMRISI